MCIRMLDQDIPFLSTEQQIGFHFKWNAENNYERLFVTAAAAAAS